MTSSAQTTSFWDVAANSLVYPVDPVVTGPMGKFLPIVAIVVGGLMFAFTEDQSKRVLAAILFAVGLLIGAASYLVGLFSL